MYRHQFPFAIPRWLVTTGLILASAGSLASTAESAQAQPYIGFRNDATGVFPADCEPVARWSEYDFGQEEYTDERGKTRKRDVATTENRHNIVWKKALPMHCNGGMIVAGGRLLLMADRGGYGYAFDHVPSFSGELLICLDPATGEELWRRDVNHLGLLPPAKAETLAEDIKLAHEFYVNCYPAFLAYRKVAAPFLGGGHGVEAIEQPTDADEQRYAEAAEAFQSWWPEVPKTVADLRVFFDQEEHDAKVILHNYTQSQFGNFMNNYRPGEKERRSRCSRAGYGWGAWYGVQSFVGNAMPTPVSDGTYVWVWTAHNDVACYDLDGERKWLRHYGGRGSGNNVQYYVYSPFLADDKLIMRAMIDGNEGKQFEWVAVDAATGEIAWRRPSGGNQNYTGTPFLFDLPIDDGTVSFFWTHYGEAIRVADGKLLGEGLGSHSYGHSSDSNRPAAALPERGIVILNNVPKGEKENDLPRKHTLALQLRATSPDQVVGEVLWSKKDGKQRIFRMVAQGDRVYGYAGKPKRGNGQLVVYQADDGEELARYDAQVMPWHLSAFAGGKVFGMSDDGRCSVVDLTDGSVHINRLGERAYGKGCERQYFNEGAQPFFSGNRIFIRSYTDVYCIGAPAQPTRLSSAHDGTEKQARRRSGQEARTAGGDTDQQAEAEPEPTRPSAPGAENLAANLAAALEQGRRPRFTLDSIGKEVEITALDDGTLTIVGSGMSMQFPLARLAQADRRALASALGR